MKLVTSNPQFVFRLLSPIENASLVGEGLARATTGSAAGARTSRSGITSRRTAPPLRTTGCLKDPESTVLRAASPGRLKSVAEPCSLAHTRICKFAFTSLKQVRELLELRGSPGKMTSVSACTNFSLGTVSKFPRFQDHSQILDRFLGSATVTRFSF